MLVNLTDVLATEGKTEEKQFDTEMDSFTYQGVTYPVSDKTPLTLNMSNVGEGKAVLKGKIKFVFVIPCDRCLKDVEYTLDLAFDREVASPDKVSETFGEESDEQGFMEGYHLDIESLVGREIILNWPMKVLCREDCRGICRQCGKDLNEGECGCDTFVPDPRMAKIKDIFGENKKEV